MKVFRTVANRIPLEDYYNCSSHYMIGQFAVTFVDWIVLNLATPSLDDCSPLDGAESSIVDWFAQIQTRLSLDGCSHRIG